MLREHVPLKNYSNYKIGGPARFFAEPRNHKEIVAAVDEWRARTRGNGKMVILGGGTNLLIDDKGFSGLVLKPNLMGLSARGEMVKVGAGVAMDDLLGFAITRNLSGFEWAGGLPGTVGGALRGNAGAFGGEMKDSVHEVVSLSLHGSKPKVIRRTRRACRFGYRMSVFKEGTGDEVILSATFRLKRGNRKAIRNAIEEKIRYRKERHPMEYPNIGSIFKNVPLSQIKGTIVHLDAHTVRVHKRGNPRTFMFTAPVKQDPFSMIPTAYLISEAGLKGVSRGGATISPKHPNFIVNTGTATAKDVKKLIALVRMKVEKRFGVALEEEVMEL